MSRGSPELTKARKEEIINAFEELFFTMSYRDISMREIEQKITMTRSSIYNYFKTKEEIFLGMSQREYQRWGESLKKVLSHETMTVSEFADAIGKSFDNQPNFFRVVSWNHTEIEENSRPERITEIQQTAYETFGIFMACIDKFFPSMNETQKKNFQTLFFTFLYGIDSYITVPPKQVETLKNAHLPYDNLTPYDAIYKFITTFLNKDVSE